MKLKILSFIAILLICTSYSKIINKNFLFTSVKTLTKDLGSNLGAFAKGAMHILAGPNADPSKCLPKEWKSPDKNEGADNANDTEEGMASNGGIMGTIVKILAPGIKMACNLKDVVINFIVDKVKKRRLRRRFLQMLKSKKLRKGFWGSVGDGIMKGVDATVDVTKKTVKVVDKGLDKAGEGIKKGVDTTIKGAKAVGDAVLSAAAKIFSPVVDKIKSIWNYFKKFFSSPMFTQIKQFIECIKKMGGKLSTNITNFMKAIVTLMSGFAGFAHIIINTICNFEKFKAAVDFLIDAIKNDGDKKWTLLGKFMGQLIEAIGSTARRLRRR